MFGKLVGLRLLAVNYQILLNNFLHISKTYGTSIPHQPALLVPPFELEPLFFPSLSAVKQNLGLLEVRPIVNFEVTRLLKVHVTWP